MEYAQRLKELQISHRDLRQDLHPPKVAVQEEVSLLKELVLILPRYVPPIPKHNPAHRVQRVR